MTPLKFRLWHKDFKVMVPIMGLHGNDEKWLWVDTVGFLNLDGTRGPNKILRGSSP